MGGKMVKKAKRMSGLELIPIAAEHVEATFILIPREIRILETAFAQSLEDFVRYLNVFGIPCAFYLEAGVIPTAAKGIVFAVGRGQDFYESLVEGRLIIPLLVVAEMENYTPKIEHGGVQIDVFRVETHPLMATVAQIAATLLRIGRGEVEDEGDSWGRHRNRG